MRSDDVSNSRYRYTKYGSRCSVDLKVVPNADLPPYEHFRTMSARASSEVKNFTNLHVPTRRENFNSFTSLQIGSDRNFHERQLLSSHSAKEYKVVTRHDHKPNDTLNVNDPKSSKALKDTKPGSTMKDSFVDKSKQNPSANATQLQMY